MKKVWKVRKIGGRAAKKPIKWALLLKWVGAGQKFGRFRPLFTRTWNTFELLRTNPSRGFLKYWLIPRTFTILHSIFHFFEKCFVWIRGPSDHFWVSSENPYAHFSRSASDLKFWVLETQHIFHFSFIIYLFVLPELAGFSGYHFLVFAGFCWVCK